MAAREGLPISAGALNSLALAVQSRREQDKVFSDRLFPPREINGRNILILFSNSNALLVGTRTKSCDQIRISSKSNKTDSNFVISDYMPV